MLKSHILAAFIALATILIPAAAHAENRIYTSAGITQFSTDDIELEGLTARATWQFDEHLAVEGEYSAPLSDDKVKGSRIELDHAAAVYGVGQVRLTDHINVVARIGVAQIKATQSASGMSRSQEATGPAYGVGLQWMATERIGIRADYTRMDSDDHTINMIGISGVLRF